MRKKREKRLSVFALLIIDFAILLLCVPITVLLDNVTDLSDGYVALLAIMGVIALMLIVTITLLKTGMIEEYDCSVKRREEREAAKKV